MFSFSYFYTYFTFFVVISSLFFWQKVIGPCHDFFCYRCCHQQYRSVTLICLLPYVFRLSSVCAVRKDKPKYGLNVVPFDQMAIKWVLGKVLTLSAQSNACPPSVCEWSTFSMLIQSPPHMPKVILGMNILPFIVLYEVLVRFTST